MHTTQCRALIGQTLLTAAWLLRETPSMLRSITAGKERSGVLLIASPHESPQAAVPSITRSPAPFCIGVYCHCVESGHSPQRVIQLATGSPSSRSGGRGNVRTHRYIGSKYGTVTEVGFTPHSDTSTVSVRLYCLSGLSQSSTCLVNVPEPATTITTRNQQS